MGRDQEILVIYNLITVLCGRVRALEQLPQPVVVVCNGPRRQLFDAASLALNSQPEAIASPWTLDQLRGRIARALWRVTRALRTAPVVGKTNYWTLNANSTQLPSVPGLVAR